MASVVDRPDVVTDEHLAYLDDLRESGKTNMFVACLYLMDDLGVSKADADVIFDYWTGSLGERHG